MKRLLAVIAVVPPCVGLAFATVNINTAQQSELQRVKGLDKFKAKQIIEYRAQNGDYRSVDDLSKIFNRDMVEAVKPQLAVTGDAYVPPPKPEKPQKKHKKSAALAQR
ncbi:MAG TPA: helix-hairpin-helix domain-containing protein [Usitatibacter sp.]|nr:helix-hairpin-helix domain-containing protein [Usitatibacter sp.]